MPAAPDPITSPPPQDYQPYTYNDAPVAGWNEVSAVAPAPHPAWPQVDDVAPASPGQEI